MKKKDEFSEDEMEAINSLANIGGWVLCSIAALVFVFLMWVILIYSKILFAVILAGLLMTGVILVNDLHIAMGLIWGHRKRLWHKFRQDIPGDIDDNEEDYTLYHLVKNPRVEFDIDAALSYKDDDER